MNYPMTSSTKVRKLSKGSESTHKPYEKIVIGKDILELLSSAMYVDPLTIYREYLQNSADSIDEAKKNGELDAQETGQVDVNIEPFSRTVIIRDNGAGLSNKDFEKRMTAFGASKKRNMVARGFRGVGRLAGLGYCRELIFRSKSSDDQQVYQISWNCQKLKSVLLDSDFNGDLVDVVNEVVSFSSLPTEEYPDHFFEVELNKIVKHKKDILLDPETLEHYIAQIAPVPFSPEFSFAEKITEALDKYIALGNIHVFIDDRETPIYRLYRDEFKVSDTITDRFTGELDMLEIPSVDGEVGAIGWVLHHNYYGAISTRTGIKGLRVRSGNIQVGEDNLLDEIFPETRFNSWTVGEVHIVDKKIRPNGRRDNFEQNIHFLNLVNHLSITGRDITKHCRTSSVVRNRIKEFEFEERKVAEKAAFLTQQALPETNKMEIQKSINESLYKMQHLTNSEVLPEKKQKSLLSRLSKIQKKFSTHKPKNSKDPLSALPAHKREIYQEVFGLIYECSVNPVISKLLIDKILSRISAL